MSFTKKTEVDLAFNQVLTHLLNEMPIPKGVGIIGGEDDGRRCIKIIFPREPKEGQV